MFRGALIIAGLALLVHLGVLLVSTQTVGAPRPPSLEAPIGGDAARGARLVSGYGCGSCHVVPGVKGARGKVGPPLQDFAERGYIAGRVANTPENLQHWIMNPEAVDPETAMPNLGVSAEDARDLASYLYHPKRGGLLFFTNLF